MKTETDLAVMRQASILLTFATKTMIDLGGEDAAASTLDGIAARVRSGRFLKVNQPPLPPAGHA